MPWSIKHRPELRIVEATFAGRICADSLLEAMMQTVNECLNHKTMMCLADCATLDAGHGAAAVEKMADLLAKTAPGGFRKAIVLPSHPKAREAVQLWETTFVARGLTVRSFADRGPALTWLRDPAIAR